jgi:hypothetical protein
MAITAALAGRRIDALDASTPRFPLAAVPLVRERLRAVLTDRQAQALVCSAACGADLVALEVAGELGLRRRVVLPFDAAKFRGTSVTDRPGDWGPLYDRIIEEMRQAGDLVVNEGAGAGDEAYAAANERILEESLCLADFPPGSGSVPIATALGVIVWEGQSRGPGDATERFATSARLCGFGIEQVLTV